MFITVVEWDGMGHVITETRCQAFETLDRAFQTLDRAFSFLLNPQRLSRVFQKLSDAFQRLGHSIWNKCSAESFDQRTYREFLIDSSVKSSFIRLTTAWNSLQSFKYLPSILKFSIQFKSLSLFSSFFSLSDIGF